MDIWESILQKAGVKDASGVAQTLAGLRFDILSEVTWIFTDKLILVENIHMYEFDDFEEVGVSLATHVYKAFRRTAVTAKPIPGKKTRSRSSAAGYTKRLRPSQPVIWAPVKSTSDLGTCTLG